MTQWYVVGGAVRDLLLGRKVHDVDISFSGGEESFLHVFPRARKTGGSLSVWLVGQDEFTALEGSPQQDMFTRDLTVNAAALDAEGRLIAHPRFLADLEGGVLRLASPRALARDPLRVFRTARFAAEFPSFSLHPSATDAMRAFARETPDALASLPAERVGRELLRALAAPAPSRFFLALREADCLSPWFRELAPAAHIPAGPLPWHDNSVLDHTLEVMDRCAGYPLAAWIALCHDLGKIRTDAAILPHHYGHELKGAELARSLASRLRLPSRYTRAGVAGTVLHMKGGVYGSLRAGTRRDMLCKLQENRIFHEFWVLAGADGGWDWEPMASRDLAAIRAVHLPDAWRNKGEASGKRLRQLQCEALSRLPAFTPERAKNAPPMPAVEQKQK
ncbi:HD domain-containing protein [Mailhella massiliensis]|uniref:HD domain-containing protein n=1 Tax=Mailhella massiliensis TaxID=1903261 RepID=A0A921AX00_9BACT|nr:HD domain-containing protein [Mailhella massiliensis]HJD97387.1 HD domain-containing protein [Mailhella massiliensis]